MMASRPPPPPGKGKGVEFAYTALRREIVSLTLRPGSPLDEAVLAARLGLSRTPVHEALVRLASESLVVLLPNRGASVASLNWDDVREMLEALDLAQRVVNRWAALRRTEAQLAEIEAERIAFERLEAAGRADDMNESNWRFHALIAAACGNKLIERNYLHLLTLALRIAYLAYDVEHFASKAAYQKHMNTILTEHIAMVAAIRDRDADKADALGRSHADLGRQRIQDVLTRGVSSALDIALDHPITMLTQ
jgi:DNA-binding GntR family transcriptional regulator